MKGALKIILLCFALVGGAWLLGTFFGSIATTGSMEEALGRTFSMTALTRVVIPLQILAALALAILLQIVLHEAGHLAFGLMTGYKFSSFSALGLVLVRQDEGLKLKRFSIPGIGGQCLMIPPQCQGTRVPVAAYNAGGVIFNILLAVIALILLLTNHNSSLFTRTLLASIIFVGIFLVLVNGIPMHVQGMPNDGYNMLKLGRNPLSRLAFVTVLRLNEMGMRGIRPRDMDEDHFSLVDDMDYTQPMQVNLLMMYITHLIDRGELDKGRHYLLKVLESPTKVYVFKLIARCELACLDWMQGENTNSDEKLDKRDQVALKALEKSCSSIKRYRFLKALFQENDIEKAQRIYKDVLDHPDRFLVKCEWEMDTEIMGKVLAERKSIQQSADW